MFAGYTKFMGSAICCDLSYAGDLVVPGFTSCTVVRPEVFAVLEGKFCSGSPCARLSEKPDPRESCVLRLQTPGSNTPEPRRLQIKLDSHH